MREEARRKRYQAEHVEPIPAEPERDLREVAEDVLGLLGGRSLTTRSKKSGREHVILMAPLRRSRRMARIMFTRPAFGSTSGSLEGHGGAGAGRRP